MQKPNFLQQLIKLIIIFLLLPFYSFSQFTYCDQELQLNLSLVGDVTNITWSSSNGLISNNILYVNNSGQFKITVDYASNGCNYSSDKIIYIDSCQIWTIYFPNALSPNGNNLTWFPKYTNVQIDDISIYDRYGHIQWVWDGHHPFFGRNMNNNDIDGVFTHITHYHPLTDGISRIQVGRITVVH
jgi:hypothetical protein